MISTVIQPRARIALLGCGTVGSSVARRLVEQGPRLGVELVRVLVRDTGRGRHVDGALLTRDFGDVISSEPDLAIEVLGGVSPAGEFVEELLARGTHVVTANKSLVARRGRDLHAAAGRGGAALAYEAAVCAGVPVLASLRHLRGDRVRAVRGIVNGSCNYVLCRMEEAGLTLTEGLAEAASRGLVEPDPSADVSGRDSVEKLCVLARAAGLGDLDPDAVPCVGIASVTPADLRAAARSGRTIRLVAEVEPGAVGPRGRVGPVLVPRGHALAGVRREENGVLIDAELAGEVFLRGPGAGPSPTASAILGDVCRVLGLGVARATEPEPDAPRRHAIRVTAATALAPRGVLEAVRAAGLVAEEVDLSTNSATVVSGASELVKARACAAGLGGDSLVMPILE